MAKEYSQNSLKKVNPCKEKRCKACGLYLNQLPIYDDVKKSNVFWVGLSAVQFSDDEEKLPLSPSTRSGALIEEIEIGYKNDIHFYKTNLVKCVPLKEDKIRYPLQHEMEKCFPNFEFELETLNPNFVFLLGKQVANFIAKKHKVSPLPLPTDFKYESYKIGNTYFIPVHHPSYILVYKRSFINEYINGIQQVFLDGRLDKKRNLRKKNKQELSYT